MTLSGLCPRSPEIAWGDPTLTSPAQSRLTSLLEASLLSKIDLISKQLFYRESMTVLTLMLTFCMVSIIYAPVFSSPDTGSLCPLSRSVPEKGPTATGSQSNTGGHGAAQGDADGGEDGGGWGNIGHQSGRH